MTLSASKLLSLCYIQDYQVVDAALKGRSAQVSRSVDISGGALHLERLRSLRSTNRHGQQP